MVKKITSLSPEQRARFDEWADKWVEAGLRTGPADRPKFEKAVERCYAAAGLRWHGRVVWVSSPLVMAIAAPTAAFVIEAQKTSSLSVAVGGAVDGAVDGAVYGVVGGAVGGAVDGAVYGAVGGAVGGAVYGAVRGAVDGAVRGAVGGAVDGAVRGAVGGAVRRVIFQSIQRGWSNYIGGQFWVSGCYWGGAYTSFFREVCSLELPGDLWSKAMAYEATTESACWWYPHKDFVMVCERPTVIHRELTNASVARGLGSHRLHCADGPAVAWPDGWGVYSVHGVQIPFAKRHIVERPELITAAEIEAEQNAEIRRVMIERYGAARYVVDSGATVVHELGEDHPLQGLRTARLLLKAVLDDEPIVYVDLLNSTPEPDGSVKRYMLRVDPNAYGGEASRNAHAAAASSWRNADGSLAYARWQDYAPVAES
jgi:hypothetical protein